MVDTTRGVVTAPAKGVLDPARARQALQLDRVLPHPDLAPFVEHFWSVRWDLRGEPAHRQQTLPYPCVHIVFDPRRPGVFGVARGAFETVLEGAGAVLGVRFRPGGFRPVLGRPVATLTDRVLSLREAFGVDDAACTARVLDPDDVDARVRAAEDFVRGVVPAPDPMVELVSRIVQRIEAEPSMTRVEAAAEAAGLGVRELQRLFREYVGVSPKWVLRRTRLQEAAHRLGRGEDLDLAALASELGYFDQAHLTRDFGAVVGRSPGSYRKAQGL